MSRFIRLMWKERFNDRYDCEDVYYSWDAFRDILNDITDYHNLEKDSQLWEVFFNTAPTGAELRDFRNKWLAIVCDDGNEILTTKYMEIGGMRFKANEIEFDNNSEFELMEFIINKAALDIYESRNISNPPTNSFQVAYGLGEFINLYFKRNKFYFGIYESLGSIEWSVTDNFDEFINEKFDALYCVDFISDEPILYQLTHTLIEEDIIKTLEDYLLTSGEAMEKEYVNVIESQIDYLKNKINGGN